MHKVAKGLAAAFIAVSTATAQPPAMAVQASPSTQSPETEPEFTNSAAIDSLAHNAQAEQENRQILGAEAASFESSMKKAFNEDAVLKYKIYRRQDNEAIARIKEKFSEEEIQKFCSMLDIISTINYEEIDVK